MDQYFPAQLSDHMPDSGSQDSFSVSVFRGKFGEFIGLRMSAQGRFEPLARSTLF